MPEKYMAKLSEVVENRLKDDQEFQTRISSLTDEEKATEVAKRKDELMEEEYGKTSTIAEDQKGRAKKAEEERDLLKNDPRLKPVADQKDQNSELSQDDMYRLATAGVHPDDVAEVKRLAKIGKDGKELTIAQTLAESLTQTILASRTEQRKTAAAADKGGGRGGAAGNTDAELLANFRKGVIPPAGSPEADRLFKLRRQGNAGSGRQS